MTTTNTEFLWSFCAAARHETTCLTWEQHRGRLDAEADFIHRLIASIPDEVAKGKSVQTAAIRKQTALLGPQPKTPAPPVFDHTNPDLGTVRVDFGTASLGEGFPAMWVTNDWHVGAYQPEQWEEDCRKKAVLAYKPRQVDIYFDGKPDEWNGKR